MQTNNNTNKPEKEWHVAAKPLMNKTKRNCLSLLSVCEKTFER
jgi:hypothetical protein